MHTALLVLDFAWMVVGIYPLYLLIDFLVVRNSGDVGHLLTCLYAMTGTRMPACCSGVMAPIVGVGVCKPASVARIRLHAISLVLTSQRMIGESVV